MKNETKSLSEITDEATQRSGMNRRGFLGAAGAFSAAAFLAACGSSDSSSDSKKTTTTAADGGDTTTTAGDETTTTVARDANNDLAVGAFAASIEFLAVSTYKAALDAATAGKLGDVPPAVGEFVSTAMKQHQDALDKWNSVLKGAGKDEVTAPPTALAKSVNDQFAKVKDIAGAAKLALSLEQAAAATYLKAIPTLATEAPIRLASSIQIIDMQHVAILLFALGQYPVPDTFASTKAAVAA